MKGVAKSVYKDLDIYSRYILYNIRYIYIYIYTMILGKIDFLYIIHVITLTL